ncbi:MAG TPA: gliding motility-associated C-terminal domain-containing protein [Edaphocola sp.]|nr:gliding motility-associated C-terminal domain-containing protein [Edaphocola sp.]
MKVFVKKAQCFYFLFFIWHILPIISFAHEHDGIAPFNINQSAESHVSFIENKGQWISDVKYKAEINGGVMFLTQRGFVYNYFSQQDLDNSHSKICGPTAIDGADVSNDLIRMHAYKVNFIGSNQQSEFLTTQKRSNYNNYYIGNDPSKWASNVGLFGEVTQKNVYSGVDLSVYWESDRGNLKYDFIVAPQVDPNQIRLSFDGVRPTVSANGDLIFQTSLNKLVEKAPYSYQIINNQKVTVASKYKLINNVLSFEFPNGYDKSQTLYIDPDLVYATYSGSTGSSAKYANSAAYDNDGNGYAAGLAYSAGWPVTTGSYQTTMAGSFIGAINKYKYDGTQLLFSTYFGGNATSGNAMPNTMRVDHNNDLYVAGTISNSTMPTTTGAFQTTMSGGSDAFIAKFNPTGTTLLASTYLGGSGQEGSLNKSTNVYTGNTAQGDPLNPINIAFDDAGSVWVTGNTGSTNFPVTGNAYQSTLGGSHDAYIVKMSSDLTAMLYGTYFGGNAWDGGLGIEFNENNNTVGVVGQTLSTNFPTTTGAYNMGAKGGDDGFAALFSNTTYQLQYSTYLGTTSNDVACRLAFDCGNNFFVAGRTNGAYPVTNTVAQGLVANGYIFLDKLTPTLSSSMASTRTGASNASIVPAAMMVDICGNILVATITNNSHQQGMPTTIDAFQTNPRGFYFAAFKPNFGGLAFGSYYGSSATGDHFHPGVSRIDKHGAIYQSVCYAGSNGTWVTYPPNVYAPNKLNGSTNDIVNFKFDFQISTIDAYVESGYAGYGSTPHAVRGCKSAFIHYKRGGDTTVPMVLRFNIIETGPDAAFNGTDYQYIEDSLVFNAMETQKTIEIKPLLVPNMPTGPKMAIIEALNPCGCETINGNVQSVVRRDTVYIMDSIRVGISTPLPAYCPGTQISITGNVDTGLDFSWSPSEFNTGSLVINPTLLTSRDFTITATQPGAPETCPPNSHTFHALVEQYPVISMSSDTIVCVVDSVPLPVVVSPDTVNYIYNWNPPTGLRAGNIASNYFKLPVGVYTYIFSARTPLANCQSNHKIIIRVRPPFEFTDVLPPSGTVVNYLDEVPMSAQGAYLYTWLPIEKYTDPTLQYPTTLPVKEPGYYYVTGIDQYGCKDTVSIYLDVKYPYDPIMPNAFTPNGDGKNDLFIIPNGKYQKIQKFEVYNRWGKRVFFTNDPLIGWDGIDENNGKICEQGVYMYIITIELPNKEMKTFKGDVSLMR